MSIAGPGREYGGKKFPQDDIPYIHPGTPGSKCVCDLCKAAREQAKAQEK